MLCIYDGTAQGGGLADRLKGILSTYVISKKCGREFKLFFKDPFNLEDYLVPNKFDWRIDKEEICYSNSDIVVMSSIGDDSYLKKKQKEWLEERIAGSTVQTHVFTNISYVYDLDYQSLFNELFKPSDRLMNSIKNQQKIIGTGYVSVSLRFLDIIGDFNETYGRGYVLSSFEIENLFSRLLKTIDDIHNENSGKRVLVNSDSVTFLATANKKDYTYIVPGAVTHIDGVQCENNYKYFEKTFLDFFMIANAEKVYLIKSKEMFDSGFPYAASRINGKPYKRILI